MDTHRGAEAARVRDGRGQGGPAVLADVVVLVLGGGAAAWLFLLGALVSVTLFGDPPDGGELRFSAVVWFADAALFALLCVAMACVQHRRVWLTCGAVVTTLLTVLAVRALVRASGATTVADPGDTLDSPAEALTWLPAQPTVWLLAALTLGAAVTAVARRRGRGPGPRG